MSPQLTSPDTPNVTFSQESADGPSPFVSPDGQILDPHGLVRALANLSHRQVKALGLRMSGIYGPPGSTSSRSVALQSSLESRLRELLSGRGSTLYTLTWKAWVTPSGVSRFRLRASAPRTSATEPIGWPTPAARDYRSEEATDEFNEKRWAHPRGKPLTAVATLAGWGTPTANEPGGTGNQYLKRSDPKTGNTYPSMLTHQVALAGWPTPMAGTPAQNGNNAAGNNDSSRKTVALASGIDGPMRITARGQILTGSDALMVSGGQLNPSHSRWLMGYPAEWDYCEMTPERKRK